MSNAKSSRFRNTLIDLEDCFEAIESKEIELLAEMKAAKIMFRDFLELCKDEGIIENYSNDSIDILLKRAANSL